MQRKHVLALSALLGITFMIAADLAAQAPGARAGRGRGAGASTGRGGGGGSYPSRPPADPAVVAQGKALFSASCAQCHAADLRGTPTGINLVRSQLVLDDENGERIARLVASSHDNGQAPGVDWNADQTLQVATYMHTFQNYRTIVMPPDTNSAILAVGNAQAGETYFAAKCGSCHSVTGDLKGIGSTYSEPKLLQNVIVSGGGGGRGRGDESSRRTVNAVVTMADGRKYEGRLISRDDFLVTLAQPDGAERTIRLNGNVPKVEVNDPMKAHRDLLRVLTDDDIHNLTAYLVTVK